MKYYLSSFGLHNPYIKVDFADHLVYPIANKFDNLFDLDYGMLLVGESFVIDKAVYEFILDDTRPYLSPMANTFRVLHSEGLLELFDLGQTLETHKDDLKDKTEFLSKDYQTWLPLLRNHWLEVNKGRQTFVNTFGSSGKEIINSHHFTLVNALYTKTGNINIEDLNHYGSIIFSKRKRFNNDEKEIIIEVLKPLVSHVLMHDLVKFESQSAILDWDDSSKYYDHLQHFRWNHNRLDEQLPIKSRQLLNLLIPQLKPNMAKELVKFISNKKSVQSLRSEIIEMISNGQEIDEKWLIQYQNQVYKHGLKKEKVMKVVKFASTAVGLFVPGGSLLVETIKEGFSALIENKIEGKILSKKHDWYYALQNNIISKI